MPYLLEREKLSGHKFLDLGIVGDGRKITDRFKILSPNRQIETCEALAPADPFIGVSVLGQFKTGQRSFLNCLISSSVLLTGVTPVSTSITRLQYGEKECTPIRYFDGREEKIPLSAIEHLTAQTRNPGNLALRPPCAPGRILEFKRRL